MRIIFESEFKKNASVRDRPGWEFNKLTSIFHAFVLLLIINFVITLSK